MSPVEDTDERLERAVDRAAELYDPDSAGPERMLAASKAADELGIPAEAGRVEQRLEERFSDGGAA